MAEEAIGASVDDAIRSAEADGREAERENAQHAIQQATEIAGQEIDQAWHQATAQRLTAISEQNSLILEQLAESRRQSTELLSSLTTRWENHREEPETEPEAPEEESSGGSVAIVIPPPEETPEETPETPSLSSGTDAAERKSRRHRSTLKFPFPSM